jgi:ribulose-phosphate 3-epimerase
VKSLRRATPLTLEAHLVTSAPEAFCDEFAAGGRDWFLVRWEGNNNPHRAVQRVKALGKRFGVEINPATPAAVLEEVMPGIDQVPVVTADPGFGHQRREHYVTPS